MTLFNDAMERRRFMTRREMLGLTAKTAAGLILGSSVMGRAKGDALHKDKTRENSMQKLRVSDNKRFLVKADGTPFIWTGDTLWCWEQLSSSEQDEYLEKRKRQGFNIVQIRLGAEKRDRGANAEGETAFEVIKGNFYDITKPNPRYWLYADRFLEKCADAGIYVAPVLMWGQASELRNYSQEALYQYAKWVGHRYRDLNHIVWMTLGEGTHQGSPTDKVLAAVKGLRDADTGNKLLTVHANNRTGTSIRYLDKVDFHTWQTSQWCAPTELPDYGVNGWWTGDNGDWTVWEAIEHDYSLKPVKPVIDAEAWYEGTPQNPPKPCQEVRRKEFGQGYPAQAYNVRRRAYFTVFAGAFGHTYGADELWQVKKNQSPNWRDALEYPGGKQMKYLRQLLESRSVLVRIPDQTLIVSGQSDSYDSHVQATRASDGSYAFIYIADGHEISVDLTAMSGEKIKAQWFNPRNGEYTEIGMVDKKAPASFASPGEPGIDNDYVLVFDSVGG